MNTGLGVFIYGILLIVGCIMLLVLIFWGMLKEDKEFSPELIQDAKYDKETEILSFKGGHTGKEYKFRGSCTVWRNMSGERMDTLMEGKLLDIWKYLTY